MKSSIPGGGQREVTRNVEFFNTSESVFDVLIEVVSTFLLEDVKEAFERGECLTIDFSKSKKYYDCSAEILHRSVFLLTMNNTIKIVKCSYSASGSLQLFLKPQLSTEN